MQHKKGFTLVEVIVVLVVLAILAAILVPAMVKWIDKAEKQEVVASARLVYVAAQSAVVEQYGLNNANYAVASCQFGGGTRGRVTNNMLGRAQGSGSQSFPAGQEVDYAIAVQILKYIDSEKGRSKKLYSFSDTYNAMGQPSSRYTKKTPGVIVSYKPIGEVDFVEFGFGSYIAHIDRNGLSIKENGKFFNGPA